MSEKRSLSRLKESVRRIDADIKRLYKESPMAVRAAKLALDEAKRRWMEAIEPQVLSLREAKRCVLEDIEAMEARKRAEIPADVLEWFEDYGVGVDFGYKGIHVRKVGPDGKWVIVTSPGSTAGQGTAAGTGGYYYAKTSHWVARVGGGSWYDGNCYLEFEGRLTPKVEKAMFEACAKAPAPDKRGRTKLSQNFPKQETGDEPKGGA